MIEVAAGLSVGNADDYERFSRDGRLAGWAIVQACKTPYHQRALGYSSRAALKEHSEYLFARRDNRLILNLVDTNDPAYVSATLIDAAMRFMGEARSAGQEVLVHCNQGRSRAPTIAMLFMAQDMPSDFGEAEQVMKTVYPHYAPANGMRTFAKANWARYRESRS